MSSNKIYAVLPLAYTFENGQVVDPLGNTSNINQYPLYLTSKAAIKHAEREEGTYAEIVGTNATKYIHFITYANQD